MIAAVLMELSKALIWTLVGSLATWLVMSVRRDREAAACEDEQVEVEFAPTLTRVRPAIEAANHLPPAPWASTERRRRLGVVARMLVASAAIADLLGLSRARPATPAPLALPAPPVPALPVGRAHVEVDHDPREEDFDTWVRVRGAELRREAAELVAAHRVDEAEVTTVLPRIAAEVAL